MAGAGRSRIPPRSGLRAWRWSRALRRADARRGRRQIDAHRERGLHRVLVFLRGDHEREVEPVRGRVRDGDAHQAGGVSDHAGACSRVILSAAPMRSPSFSRSSSSRTTTNFPAATSASASGMDANPGVGSSGSRSLGLASGCHAGRRRPRRASLGSSTSRRRRERRGLRAGRERGGGNRRVATRRGRANAADVRADRRPGRDRRRERAEREGGHRGGRARDFGTKFARAARVAGRTLLAFPRGRSGSSGLTSREGARSRSCASREKRTGVGGASRAPREGGVPDARPRGGPVVASITKPGHGRPRAVARSFIPRRRFRDGPANPDSSNHGRRINFHRRASRIFSGLQESGSGAFPREPRFLELTTAD